MMRRGRLQHGFYYLLATARAELELAETAYKSGLYDEGDARVAKAETAMGSLLRMVREDQGESKEPPDGSCAELWPGHEV